MRLSLIIFILSLFGSTFATLNYVGYMSPAGGSLTQCSPPTQVVVSIMAWKIGVTPNPFANISCYLQINLPNSPLKMFYVPPNSTTFSEYQYYVETSIVTPPDNLTFTCYCVDGADNSVYNQASGNATIDITPNPTTGAITSYHSTTMQTTMQTTKMTQQTSAPTTAATSAATTAATSMSATNSTISNAASTAFSSNFISTAVASSAVQTSSFSAHFVNFNHSSRMMILFLYLWTLFCLCV